MANPSPEARARVKIDAQLADAGWYVCDRNHRLFDDGCPHGAGRLRGVPEGESDGQRDDRSLAEIFGDIKARSASLAKNVALLEKLLKGVGE